MTVQKKAPAKAKGHKKVKQSECTTRVTQLKTIFQYLKDHVATASMVTAATGVVQKNICRYKRDLEKAGRLFELYKMECKETGFKAWYLTTDPSKMPSSNQLNLFKDGEQ